MPESSAPPIRFVEILQGLVDNSAFRKNRRPIWEELNITSAALSQYLSGQTRPRLETLVGLAHFFGVSLDYLLLGKETSGPPPEDARPYVRYVDWALADVQNRVAYHDWLIGKIGRRIAERIDQVALELSVSDHLAGVLTVDDQIVLESHSLYTKVLCTTLEDDLIFSEGGEVAAGRFLHILAKNIKENPPRPYEFLLPERVGMPWQDVIHALRRVLSGELQIPRDRMSFCTFRRIYRRSFCGNAFYKLDVAALKTSEPVLWETLRPYATDEGWVGYLLKPNREMQANVLYASSNVSSALNLFDEWWAMGVADI